MMVTKFKVGDYITYPLYGRPEEALWKGRIVSITPSYSITIGIFGDSVGGWQPRLEPRPSNEQAVLDGGFKWGWNISAHDPNLKHDYIDKIVKGEISLVGTGYSKDSLIKLLESSDPDSQEFAVRIIEDQILVK